jgi:hypothetical protein
MTHTVTLDQYRLSIASERYEELNRKLEKARAEGWVETVQELERVIVDCRRTIIDALARVSQ